jgi:hypothetical protein
MRGGIKRTIVSPHKGIAVIATKLAIHELLGLFESDVHVTVNGLQFA